MILVMIVSGGATGILGWMVFSARWEDRSLSRVKIEPGKTFGKIVPQSEAKTCACPYDSGGGWHNCEFKAFDAATGGTELAKFDWHCTKCRQ